MRKAKKAVRKAAKARERDEAAKAARAKRAAIRKQAGMDIGQSGGKKPVGQCFFCLEKKPLVESHIIPKFHNKGMRNEKGHFVRGDPEARKKKLVQDHGTSPLFCKSCDGEFSNVERPYSEWWKTVGLTRRKLESGRRHFVEKSGHWSEAPAGDDLARPTIVLRGVDMPLLKKMHLINIFRMLCHSSGVRDGVAADVERYREIVRRFIPAPKRESALVLDSLADFSIKATCVFFQEPSEQLGKDADVIRLPPILPAKATLMGTFKTDPHGDACCLIEGVLWEVGNRMEDPEKKILTMKTAPLQDVLPDSVVASMKRLAEQERGTI